MRSHEWQYRHYNLVLEGIGLKTRRESSAMVRWWRLFARSIAMCVLAIWVTALHATPSSTTSKQDDLLAGVRPTLDLSTSTTSSEQDHPLVIAGIHFNQIEFQSDSSPAFFQDEAGSHPAWSKQAVLQEALKENPPPGDVAIEGWTDAFVFTRIGDGWSDSFAVQVNLANNRHPTAKVCHITFDIPSFPPLLADIVTALGTQRQRCGLEQYQLVFLHQLNNVRLPLGHNRTVHQTTSTSGDVFRLEFVNDGLLPADGVRDRPIRQLRRFPVKAVTDLGDTRREVSIIQFVDGQFGLILQPDVNAPKPGRACWITKMSGGHRVPTEEWLSEAVEQWCALQATGAEG